MKNTKPTYAFALIIISAIFSLKSFSQTIGGGSIHGNFEADAQTYTKDTLIGAPAVPQKFSMNAFADFDYTSDHFSAGLRFESYQNALQGYDQRYSGNGILYRYLSYKNEGLEVTVGSFYEQFGSGMILRSYQEWGLGFDNAIDGIRVKYSPLKGITLKGLVGNQREYMTEGKGIVRGFDGEISLNEAIKNWDSKKTKITLGGSFVSKYQNNQGTPDTVPANVGSYAGRFNITRGKFSISGEGAYKINDPDYVNNFIYKPGDAVLLNIGYSKPGFGLTFAAERIDNMDYRSDRNATLTDLLINFLPALNKTHTYSLAAFYPYATQPNGEEGVQAEMFHLFKPKTFLGGKYGTNVDINFSENWGIDKQKINDSTAIGTTNTDGYKSDFFKVGRQIYFRDINIEITKKISKTFNFVLTYLNLVYDKDVIQPPGNGTIYSNIIILESFFNITSTKTLRIELQHLSTPTGLEDPGAITNKYEKNWAMALAEYSIAPHWFFAASDMYNYGNDLPVYRLHYFNGSLGFTQNTFRFTLGYGQQRAGIYCVGGVCRNVPASNGFKFSISSSF